MRDRHPGSTPVGISPGPLIVLLNDAAAFEHTGVTVRLSVIVLLVALAGFLGGGALIGTWCLGLCLMVESAAAVAWALLRDDGPVAAQGVPTLVQVLERARAS